MVLFNTDISSKILIKVKEIKEFKEKIFNL